MMGAEADPSLTWSSKQVELVKKVETKTRQRKIQWRRTGSLITASIPGGLQFGFVRSPVAFLMAGQGWTTFSVRDQGGNEILKVENQGAVPISTLLGLPREPDLVSAAGDLYRAVEGVAKDEIDKAIEQIDKM